MPTPVERATLKRLLAEHDAFEAFLKDSPTAHQEREQRAAKNAACVPNRTVWRGKNEPPRGTWSIFSLRLMT